MRTLAGLRLRSFALICVFLRPAAFRTTAFLNRDMFNHFVLMEVCSVDIFVVCLRVKHRF